ncbi:hypothetical protein DEO72_LG8g1286 [Vigna unguiculata]|uniref:Uncharacterized protein n=1 Tax=Vigna unguiculata TaxID=3917 RepID=A0A4D6MRP5_VIGUN|nr:hypothetical protein DEO72_LG8g1286 [Vigna unguiculata]
MHDKEVWTFSTSDAHNPSPPTLFPPSRVPSSPVDFHAKAFACINHSLANLHLQQQRHQNEFEQFRDTQLLHQQCVEQLLQDTMALLRSHH